MKVSLGEKQESGISTGRICAFKILFVIDKYPSNRPSQFVFQPVVPLYLCQHRILSIVYHFCQLIGQKMLIVLFLCFSLVSSKNEYFF
jgi:hypothetical protein